MSKPYLKITESVNSFIQNAILSTIFVFKSNIYQINQIFEKILAPILFPLVIIPDAIASLFAFYHFSKAKNKNLGKTIDLIHAPIKAALVFTAVFAGLSLIFVQGLFLTAVGSSVIYHLGLSIFHVYHWLKSEKNLPASILHKNHVINNFTATTIGTIVVVGIILTMVVAPYLTATFLAVSGLAVPILLMLVTISAIYWNFKNSPPTNEIIHENYRSSPLNHLVSDRVLISNSKNSNYYYREFRTEKLSNNKEKDKTFLLEEISNKKRSLKLQIESPRNSFFRRIWSENPKRQIKIDLLTILEARINSNDTSQLSIPNQAYQSFFRAFGDTEDIIEATKLHLGTQ